MMNRLHTADNLITDLVGQLEPVRPLRFASGLGWTLATMAVSIAAVVLMFGLRPGMAAGDVDPMLLLAMGLFLLLGLACASTVVVMSRPRVGSDHSGWRWAAAMAALVPVAAALTGFDRVPDTVAGSGLERGLECFASGAGFGLLTAGVLVWWLRRGAPTSPERAGLLVGIAAGYIGSFAFSFQCSDSDIVHIGLWHSATVVVSAVIGRMAVPGLVRW